MSDDHARDWMKGASGLPYGGGNPFAHAQGSAFRNSASTPVVFVNSGLGGALKWLIHRAYEIALAGFVGLFAGGLVWSGVLGQFPALKEGFVKLVESAVYAWLVDPDLQQSVSLDFPYAQFLVIGPIILFAWVGIFIARRWLTGPLVLFSLLPTAGMFYARFAEWPDGWWVKWTDPDIADSAPEPLLWAGVAFALYAWRVIWARSNSA